MIGQTYLNTNDFNFVRFPSLEALTLTHSLSLAGLRVRVDAKQGDVTDV
jgi:hypothetical protein